MSKILIADGNGDAAGLLASWLLSEGHSCTTAPTSDALGEVRRLTPEVAVVVVGGIDHGGMWIVRTLRTQHVDTAVVVVASPPDFDVATSVNRLGVVDCLPGPPTRGALLDAVTRAGLWRTAVEAAKRSVERYPDEIARQRSALHATLAGIDPDAAQSVLLAILESRTPDTHDHAQRVAQLSMAIGRRLGMNLSDLDQLQRAALLHDIGKIAMPPRLLADSRNLPEADLAVLREHVTIGADILRAIPGLAQTAAIVEATHEHVDGAGYPNGTRGDDIPLDARIIAVADVYDAMTGVRTYREPVSREQANRELLRVSGSHLDAAVVSAWLGMTEDVRCS